MKRILGKEISTFALMILETLECRKIPLHLKKLNDLNPIETFKKKKKKNHNQKYLIKIDFPKFKFGTKPNWNCKS